MVISAKQSSGVDGRTKSGGEDVAPRLAVTGTDSHPLVGRRAALFGFAVVGPGLITLLALSSVSAVVPALLSIGVIATAASVGGRAAGLVAAAASAIAYTYFFTLPPEAFTLAGANDVAVVVSFVLVGLCVGQIVAYEQRVRARVGRAQRRAEDSANRLSRLATVARSLAFVRMPSEVLDVVLRDGVTAARSQAGLIALVGTGGSTFEIAGYRGYRADRLDAWLRHPVGPHLALAETVLAGEPVYLAAAADDRRFSLLTTADEPSPALAALPLAVDGHSAAGLLLLSFDVEQEFGSEQRTLLEALAAQAAQALERTLLNERETEARHAAESNRAQLQLSLADLEAERAKLVTLVERLHEGVIAVDPGGVIAFANAKAKNALGADGLPEGSPLPEEWHGFPLRSFATGLFDAGDRVEAEIGSFESGTHYSIVGLPATRSETALLVIGDLSERERRERAEREFVSNAAHELRTPLTSISLAVSALQAGAKEVPTDRDRFLAHIEHDSARLNRLAHSLLVLARTQSTAEPPRRSPVALRPLLVEVMAELEPKAGVEVALSCPERLTVVSNRDLLEHVLLNLVTNAVRYTERGTVQVVACGRGDGSATLEVHDTGPGIPTESQSTVFDRFYRADSRQQGFGLGLAIVRQAVEALGGRVALESTPDAGTMARVELPATASSAAA